MSIGFGQLIIIIILIIILFGKFPNLIRDLNKGIKSLNNSIKEKDESLKIDSKSSISKDDPK